MKLNPIVPGLLLVCATTTGTAQTSLQMSRLETHFITLSRSTTLAEAQKSELKKLEDSARAARARSETGLTFRELHRGTALLEGRAWTAQVAFTTSLALEPEAVVCDPSKPLAVRVRQYFPAPLDGNPKLMVHASLGRGDLAQTDDAGAGKAQSLGKFPGAGGDMAKEPFRFTVQLGRLEDSAYQLVVELHDGEKLLHRLTAPLIAVRGFDTKRVDIEARLANVAGFEQAKASIRYPFDFARVLNGGTIEPASSDFVGGLARSEELLKSIEAGKDPLPDERGLLKRHYVFTEAGEVVPYGLVVPKSYDGTKAMPLIIALHGSGGTENTMMQAGDGVLPRVAEERGFLVATPSGYRRNGGYGRTVTSLGELDSESLRISRLSEQDVLNVLKLVRANYRVDPARIYLMGHSMGGNGTWRLGSKYPEIWAALAPIAGGSAAASKLPLANLKPHNIPVYTVHGDADRTSPVENTRSMVAELKELGLPHKYHEIPGGTHNNVVGPAIPHIVEFFSRHQRADK